jgi:hypothetical protein
LASRPLPQTNALGRELKGGTLTSSHEASAGDEYRSFMTRKSRPSIVDYVGTLLGPEGADIALRTFWCL